MNRRIPTPSLLVLMLLAQAPLAAGQFIAPNENLVADGIPPVPAQLAEQVQRYTEFRAAGLLDWHPQKREMLIQTRFADVPQIHHLSMPGGARRQLTFFPDGAFRASFNPVDGDYFVFWKDQGGDEFYQGYRYDLATGDTALLTDGKSRNIGARWSTRGDRIVYTSTRRNGKDPDFYIMDPAAPQQERLLATMDKPGWGVSDWSPDDSRLLVYEYISANESHLWLMDVKSGEKRPLTPRGPGKVAYGGAQFSPDGRGIYLSHDRRGEFQELLYLDLETSEETALTADIPWDVEDFDISDDGRHIAFITNEDGINVLRLMDAATRKQIPAPRLPPGQVGGLRWHKNNRDLALRISSARAPSDVYSIDVVSGEVQRWTESETGGLNTATFAEPQLIRWTSFDGRTISGFLFRPDPARHPGDRPVIISIHGGPESQFRPGFMGRWNYYLNELGVALLFPNVRGSSGYGKTFLTLDNGYQREDAVKDIGALLDWISGPDGRRENLDPQRIMVTGGSYGGYMSLAVAIHFNDRIRCAVDVVGISNFVSFLESTQDYRRDLRRAEYGDERDPAMREFLTRISPTTNAARITRPLLVVQGRNDPRVPLGEAEQIVRTVRQNGGPVWYLLANDEGHGFAKKKNADYQFYVTILFAREHLLN